MEIDVGTYSEKEVADYIKRVKARFDEAQEFEDKFRKEYGITTYDFLKEFMYVVEHSGRCDGTTTTGKTISSDYGYIEGFINDIVEEVKSHK